MVVPYNSDLLLYATKESTSAAASPFVVAVQIAGIKVLPGFLNACVLIFVFSGANSDLYVASRTIHGLALKKHAPAFLAITDKRGVPYYSLGLSSLICCIAFMNVSTASKTVFSYFVNLVSIFGLLTWISILVSHIYFVRARRAQVCDNARRVPSRRIRGLFKCMSKRMIADTTLIQGISDDVMPYKSPFGLSGSVIALFFCCLIALTKNFSVFVDGFDYKDFITGYLGIPLYLIMICGYKIVMRSHGVKPHEADLFSGKDVIDADEQEWLARDAECKAGGKQQHWLYRYTLGLLF